MHGINLFSFFFKIFAKIEFSNGLIIEGEIYPPHGQEARRPFSVSKTNEAGKVRGAITTEYPMRG
jgi:hypothetical protein